MAARTPAKTPARTSPKTLPAPDPSSVDRLKGLIVAALSNGTPRVYAARMLGLSLAEVTAWMNDDPEFGYHVTTTEARVIDSLFAWLNNNDHWRPKIELLRILAPETAIRHQLEVRFKREAADMTDEELEIARDQRRSQIANGVGILGSGDFDPDEDSG